MMCTVLQDRKDISQGNLSFQQIAVTFFVTFRIRGEQIYFPYEQKYLLTRVFYEVWGFQRRREFFIHATISIISATFQVKKEKLLINITGKYGNIWSGLILPVDAGDRRVCLGLYTGC